MESVYQWHCKVLMKAHVCQCECFCVKPNGHSLQEVEVIPAVSIWTLNTSQMSNTPTPHTTQWHLRVILNPNINFVFKHEVEFLFFLSLSLVPIMQLCGQKWHYKYKLLHSKRLVCCCGVKDWTKLKQEVQRNVMHCLTSLYGLFFFFLLYHFSLNSENYFYTF